ncbi:MAG: glycosyltransferase family 39 protein [Fimbriimonadaceae bacterium]|nr:glycosyltransferase family 39 protein [Fimbriimonadaceae bacterium]
MSRGERVCLNLIVLWAFGFSLVFALTNPIFEAPDEPAHLDYVNYVSQHWTMPYQLSDGPRIGQGHHHPLYYFLTAPFLAAVESGQPIDYQIVPHRLSEDRDDVPRFSQRFTYLMQSSDKTAFYLLRVLNAIFVALAALYAALAARLVIGKPYALFAGLFVASLPQFQFIGGSISNDALTACLGCVSLYALLRAGLFEQNLKGWAWAGFWVGMAVLAKKSNLVIVPAALLWVMLAPVQDAASVRSLRLRFAGVFAGVLLLTCGWLFVRNIVTYNDVLGTRMEARTMPELVQPKTLADPYFRGYFERITARTFFGHFGWMNVTVSLAYIIPLALLLFGGLLASWKGLKELGQKSVWWFATAWVVLTIGGLFYYNLTFTQPQGRLLFPALAPLSLLFGAGMAKILERIGSRNAQIAIWAVAILLLVINVLCLLVNVRFYGRPGIES